MAIPQTIYQTFKSNKLPLITKWHINTFRKNNPEYRYEFYDDERIDLFFKNAFSEDIYSAYKQLNIGAAEADMFRYAILYKKGGIYLDIDSGINSKLNSFIHSNDSAIITLEGCPDLFAQWALISESNHPFLKKTLDLVVENISKNRFPNDVHAMTGPTVYTQAINECLAENPSIPYRILGTDYDGHLKVKYKLGKFFLYSSREHWKKQQLHTTVLKNTG